MNRVQFLLAAALVLVFTCAAQGAQKPAIPKYDTSTEVTLKGVVAEIKDFQCPISGSLGAHLVLRLADGSTIEAHLAPVAFMKEFDIVINPGDQVELIGSKVMLDGAPTILARQVNSNNYTYTFRSEQGRPLW